MTAYRIISYLRPGLHTVQGFCVCLCVSARLVTDHDRVQGEGWGSKCKIDTSIIMDLCIMYGSFVLTLAHSCMANHVESPPITDSQFHVSLY